MTAAEGPGGGPGEKAVEGGRIFFSGAGRSLIEEDEIELTSVGVDIGSSTSHILFSRIVLERVDTRYIVAEREVLHRSAIALTPYSGAEEIDAEALRIFIGQQYRAAGLPPQEIDTGALILTGVAVRRQNARAIGELFSAEAGKFVAVSAGDALETLMAAHGSGAAARSAETGRPVLNIDIGGGTTKLALCVGGEVAGVTAVEAGARLVVGDGSGRVGRIEPFGARYLAELGAALAPGDPLSAEHRRKLAGLMADRIFAAASGADLGDWLRLPPLAGAAAVSDVIFSGGVSEYVYGREARDFDDLGRELAAAVLERVAARRLNVLPALEGIRATVIGASQYTVQVSGSTIFLDPEDVLPLRNIPVIAPALDLSGDVIDADAVAEAVRAALIRLDLADGARPVAVAVPWRGSAMYRRLDALARGLIAGLAPVLEAGHPLVMVLDGDVGGLLGIHCRQERRLANPVVSIDGIELKEFDFIDIGAILRATGAVPVVIKSLLFP